MLVLSLKKNERVMIGDNISVFVIESIGGRVKLGFEAPADVIILRQEIYDARKKANGESGKVQQ